MIVEVSRSCEEFTSYRAMRVKSLFNCASGATFTARADLPAPGEDWQIGVIVGPSGSGKSLLGAEAYGAGRLWQPAWPGDAPIIDCIGAGGDFDAAASALSAVGLGDVPAWLRPYSVLSNGEEFRADLARLVAERPALAVVDEFSSVVDRQIAQIGAAAFARAWRRGPGRTVLLSCHYDILDWLQPDWVFDTRGGVLERGAVRQKPRIELDIFQTNWQFWPLFEPHHYLKAPQMVAATCYVGAVGGEAVAHVAFSTRPGLVEARACRMVVLPEWQGAGVGMRFLNAVCQRWLEGGNRFNKPMPTLFHTSHPGLCATLRRDRRWTQVSAMLAGAHRGRSHDSMRRAAEKSGGSYTAGGGYGGHFRAVQGFRYLGEGAS